MFYLRIKQNKYKKLFTEEVIKKAEEIDSKNSNDSKTKESIEPLIKRRRTVFEFIKEQQFDEPSNDIVNECSVQIDAYFRETSVEKHDILEWWQQNKFKQKQYKFTNIYQLVKKYLCIPATSCPSERVFSDGKLETGIKRSKLSQKHVNQLLFLNHNLRNL